jgi:hypothetical protein
MHMTLWADPSCNRGAIEGVEVEVERPRTSLLRLRYAIVGDIAQLVVPPPSPAPVRTHGLWESTCVELFLRGEGENNYLEFNFSPSGDWAAFAFSRYRHGMVQAELPAPPDIETEPSADRLIIDIAVSPYIDDRPYLMNVAAITQGPAGERAFWSGFHPDHGPDFHHPSCFIDQLPPAPRP